MASLSNWSLHDLTHRREIRSVASAFVGEIAAILHLIETHDVVAMVAQALDASGGPAALPNLTLPAFTIYTADAARLDELPLPVPRKIAYFYAQIASIRDDLTLVLSRAGRHEVKLGGEAMYNRSRNAFPDGAALPFPLRPQTSHRRCCEIECSGPNT